MIIDYRNLQPVTIDITGVDPVIVDIILPSDITELTVYLVNSEGTRVQPEYISPGNYRWIPNRNLLFTDTYWFEGIDIMTGNVRYISGTFNITAIKPTPQSPGISSLYNIKGTKEDVSELPLTGNSQGDVWVISSNNSQYVWVSKESSGVAEYWVEIGALVDLSGYALLDSPEFIGVPTVPNASVSTETQQIANTKFVKDSIKSSIEDDTTGLIVKPF